MMKPCLNFFEPCPDLEGFPPGYVPEEWMRRSDQLGEAYQRYFDSVRTQLPLALVRLCEGNYHLHDGRVTFAERREDTLRVHLRVGGPTDLSEHDLLVCLTYRQVIDWGCVKSTSTMFDAAVAAESPSVLEQERWLTDEVRRAEGATEHHVLFYGASAAHGMLAVRFLDFDYELVPMPEEGDV
jgi:hypothetical protein